MAESMGWLLLYIIIRPLSISSQAGAAAFAVRRAYAIITKVLTLGFVPRDACATMRGTSDIVHAAAMRGRNALEAEQLGQTIVESVVGKMGEDVVLLDIRTLSSIADYFVICSGASERQLHALAEEVRSKMQTTGTKLLRGEGSTASGWLLMDFGSVVVHIFSPPTRRYYNLEQLWKDARTVVRIL